MNGIGVRISRCLESFCNGGNIATCSITLLPRLRRCDNKALIVYHEIGCAPESKPWNTWHPIAGKLDGSRRTLWVTLLRVRTTCVKTSVTRVAINEALTTLINWWVRALRSTANSGDTALFITLCHLIWPNESSNLSKKHAMMQLFSYHNARRWAR